MEQLIAEHRFELPPFCSFTPEEWQEKGTEYQEIRDNMLGWDVTDYGQGRFSQLGFALITLRNGNLKNPAYTKTYAEKLLMLREGQYSPMHFTGIKWRISSTGEAGPYGFGCTIPRKTVDWRIRT